MSPYRKNLRIVAWLRVLHALLFSIPIITLYWRRNGLDLLDIFWLQAVFALSIVVFEIPTGYIGDRIGRKKTLLLCCAIAATGWLLYAWAHTFGQFLFAEVYLGLAFGFLSGTDTALVYESLEALGEPETFTRIEGQQYAFNHLAEAGAALVGGLMAGFLPLHWTFLASGAASLLAFCLCLGITEPRRQTAVHPRGTWYGFYKILRFVFLKSELVRWVVPLMAACSLATMLGVWLYQPLWEERQVPIWLFGLLWAALSIPASLASRYAHRLERWLGKARVLWLLPAPALLGYLVLGLAPGCWALGGAYFVPALRGLHVPILSKYIQEETFSDKRATVMSIQSWLFRLAYFVVGPGIGWLAKHRGLPMAFFAAAAVALLSIGAFLPPVLRRVRALHA
jgi:MFS family permease